MSLKPGLYVVATPIGTLADISARALDILGRADLIAAEDTRVSGKLTSHYGIRTPMMPYHDHNADAQRPKILGRIRDGQAVALISDAGTPLISDPGHKLVAAARDEGLYVTSAPGPSAVVTALSICGLPADRFLFAGFLPAKSGARKSAIGELEKIPATLVFYESPHRLKESLGDLAAVLGARPAAVCRELTKMFEEVRLGDLVSLSEQYAGEDEVKGEIVLVISPPEQVKKTADEAALDAVLKPLLEVLSTKDAAKAAAALTGYKKAEAYDRALKLKP